MSGGAFRDASAAIERAAMLEDENATLRGELAEMAKLRIEVEELAKVRAEVEDLRALARSENEGAYVKRLSEERDELDREVKALRERLAVQEQELTKLRWREKRSRGMDALEPVLASIVGFFKPKK